MYAPLARAVFEFMRLPAKPPEVPAGGYASVQVFRASPRWLQYRFVQFWIVAAIFFAFALGATLTTLITGKVWALALVAVVGAIVLAFLLFAWFCLRIEYDLRTYVVTDRSLRVREGAWVFKEMTLTYANVQNVQVLQGPIQRLFRIEDLRVDTAGGGGMGKGERPGSSGHSVTLAGLEDARAVRDLILSFVKNQTRGSGLGDLDDPEHARGARNSISSSRAVVEALRSMRTSAEALRRAAEARAK